MLVLLNNFRIGLFEKFTLTYRYLHRRPAGLSGRRLAQRTRGAGSLCCNDLSLLPAEYVGNLVAPCAGAASGSMIGVIESNG